MTENPQQHWQTVWRDREPTEVSWFQADPTTSRRLIARVARPHSAIVDVGGGGSRLVDHLLDDGYRDLTVLDISEAALDVSRRRLGDRAASIDFVVADVTAFRTDRRFDVWHDRAVFHFLVDHTDRERYRRTLVGHVVPGGHLVVATFGPDGPEYCSGLPVRRYDLAGLMTELAPVELVEHVIEDHETPSGDAQQFLTALLRFAPDP